MVGLGGGLDPNTEKSIDIGTESFLVEVAPAVLLSPT